MQIAAYTAEKTPSAAVKKEIVDFLFTHLEEYGDPREEIERAVSYALKEIESFGGFILAGRIDGTMVGAVVVNATGMKDYIPENILVYIATHHDYRGQGLGKQLMRKALELADGNVALHVEPDNPARYLYEKVGFTSKYIEMRHKKNAQH